MKAVPWRRRGGRGHTEPLFLSFFPSSVGQHSDLSSEASVLLALAHMVPGGLISHSGAGRLRLDLELKCGRAIPNQAGESHPKDFFKNYSISILIFHRRVKLIEHKLRVAGGPS